MIGKRLKYLDLFKITFHSGSHTYYIGGEFESSMYGFVEKPPRKSAYSVGNAMTILLVRLQI